MWARNAGSQTAFDAWSSSGPHVVEPPAPLNLTSLSTDDTFPAAAGTPVTWTARAEGGTGPYTFKFYVFDGTTWTVGQDWGAANTWRWVPPSSGNYWIQAWVRNAGSVSLYDAWTWAGAAVSSATALSNPVITLVPMAPLVVGAPANITARVKGGTGPYTYQVYVFNGTTWSVVQPWSPANHVTWVPSVPGTYTFEVWVRNAGSSSTLDQWGSFGP